MKKLPFSNQKGAAHFLLLVLLIIGLGVGLYLISKPTIFKPKADYEPAEKIGYDSEKYRGMGVNSFFSLDDKTLLSTRPEGAHKALPAKWVRVAFFWNRAEPTPGNLKTRPGEYLGPGGEFDSQVKYWKDKGFNISFILMGSPGWTATNGRDGWWDLMSQEEKQRFGLSNLNRITINPGPITDEGKQSLTRVSEYLFRNFPEIDLYENRNEPIGKISEMFYQEDGIIDWAGFFGFNIDTQGRQITCDREGDTNCGGKNESDYRMIGAKEFAEYTKAFYKGKLNAGSNKPVAYAGAMYHPVGSHPDSKDSLQSNIDRRFFYYLKQLCPENGCFDVMNFHHYDNGIKGQTTNCNNPLQLNQGSSIPNQISRENHFHCHDPYALSEWRGVVRRVKYDLNDVLGMPKPLFMSEFGRRWSHVSEDDKQETMNRLVQIIAELRSEGVDGMIYYDMGGHNGEDLGLTNHVYRHGEPYAPDEYADGPIFATFAWMAKFINENNYVKYGGFENTTDKNDPDRYGKNITSYLFVNKSNGKFTELLWKKNGHVPDTGIDVNVPFRLYRLNYSFSRDTDPVVIVEEKEPGGVGISNQPVIIEYSNIPLDRSTPYGNIDYYSDSSPNTLVLNGFKKIHGWVVSDKKAIDRIDIIIDNKKVGQANYGGIRDDICGNESGHIQPHFNFPQCPFVGFTAEIDNRTLGLSRGGHKLQLVAYDGVGGKTVLPWGGDNNQRCITLAVDGSAEKASDGLECLPDNQGPLTQPVVSVSCKENTPSLSIDWAGTPGQGVPEDNASVGKTGYYVDISDDNFNMVYNKFVENTTQTDHNGFVLANNADGSPLLLTPGKTYKVRIYNGQHSPVSEPFTIYNCGGLNASARIEYEVVPKNPKANQPFKINIKGNADVPYIAMSIKKNQEPVKYGWLNPEEGLHWSTVGLTPGTYVFRLVGNCSYAPELNCNDGKFFNQLTIRITP